MQPLSGSPFTRSYALDAGPRVSLRLARRSDAQAVCRLLGGRDVAATELEVARLLSFHPGRRVVLCATAPLDGHETLVGIGAIDLEPGAEPDTLVVDERITEGLGELIGCVLRSRAAGRGRRAA